MDFMIINTAFCVFIPYLLIHVVMFKCIKSKNVQRLCMGLLFGIGIILCLWNTWSSPLFVMVLSVVIFVLLVLLYKSFLNASMNQELRGSILVQLNSKDGLTLPELNALFTSTKIAHQTIQRLEESHWIAGTSEGYHRNLKFKTLFLIGSLASGMKYLVRKSSSKE